MSVKTLNILFRYCRIVKIDRVVEFRFDKKVMQEIPSKTSVNQELLDALKEAGPLPSTVKAFLEDKKQVGGAIRVCSPLFQRRISSC